MSLSDIIPTWLEITTFFTHLTHHIVPGPNSGSYFIPFVLLPTALLIPPSVLSHRQLYIIFLPIIWGCQIHAWSVGGADVIGITLALWSGMLLGLRDPRGKFRRLWVDGEGNDGTRLVREEPYPERFARRVTWVLTLLVSLRLTGWKIGEEAHDRTQPPPWLSGVGFLKVASSTVVQSYVILDATSCYVRTDPYFTTSEMGVDASYPASTPETSRVLLMLRFIAPRLLRSCTLAAQIHAMVTSMFFLPTIPVLGLNALEIIPNEWSPHTWPVFFGDFSAVYERGLRGLWGSWWHRMNMQITATYGRSLAEALGISRRSTLKFALLTISAFTLSGVIHMGMIPPEPVSAILSANTMRLYVAGFFWAQVPAFGVELLVSSLAAHLPYKVAQRPVTRLLILIWVMSWLCLTLPMLVVPFREIGYWQYHAVPVSLLRGLAGKSWMAR